METKKRGRPSGLRLSEDTKDKIRQSRIGRSHSSDTKDKISKSLTKHFKNKDPLSESMEREYSEYSNEVGEWICDAECQLNDLDDVMTSKRLLYLNQIEVSYGHDIESFCHNATPEFLLILKEDLIELGLIKQIDELNSLI